MADRTVIYEAVRGFRAAKLVKVIIIMISVYKLKENSRPSSLDDDNSSRLAEFKDKQRDACLF